MKQLIVKIILPLTIISFAFVTRWWYVLPVDARQTFYWGFPFAFVGEGWQTSGALQFFLLEGLADFSTYFVFWFVITYLGHHFAIVQKSGKVPTRIIWSIACLILVAEGIIIFSSYTTMHLIRDYDWQLINSGFKFIWQNTPLPNEH